MTVLLAIGTRKGLWLARRNDRGSWTLDGPHLPGQEVAAVAVDVRRPSPRILAGGGTMHFGPTVNLSDDMGATWQEPEKGAIEFPADTGAALARVWQLLPDPAGRRTWSGPAANRRRCGAATTAVSISRWSGRCGTTRIGRTGIRARVGLPFTRSCRTSAPSACSSR